jgi:hypothetical protein
MQARKRISLLVVPVAIAMSGFAAHAADETQSSPAPAQVAVPAASADGSAFAPAATTAPAPRPAQADRFGVAMTDDQLDRHRGGDALIAQADLTGTHSNTTANRVQTGSNSINQGSFANSSGLPTVIQNTGANVLIQNATIVNVRFGE